MTVSAVAPLKVFAYDNNQFYSSNDILFYDGDDKGGAGCASANEAVSELFGSDNKQKIYNFWLSKGLSPAQSAGITANMQFESGFSPFRQEDAKNWPSGGYGIAQFTNGQRTAVTDYLSSELGNDFDDYYSDEYGGKTNSDDGYIPGGISEDINDKFLLGELNYLYEYTSSFVPSTIPIRVSGLSTDYGITIGSGEKLLDFIRNLSSAGDVAKAWTYLYEQPGEIKSTAAARATAAENFFENSGGSASGSGNCNVGIGGLNFEQAKTFMQNYYDDRFPYFDNFWSASGQSNQCTAFVYYFNTRFITLGTGSGDGGEVVANLISGFPNQYNSVTSDNIQPFSVYSLKNGGAGHTGVVLGIESDGSVVIGEANAALTGSYEGLIESEVIGDKGDQELGVVSIGHWESLEAWETAMSSSWGLSDPNYAAPSDLTEVISKVQDSLN